MKNKIAEVKKEINNHINGGIGVLLKWKGNNLYKFHKHHEHLDGEEALTVLLVESVTIQEFVKILDPSATSIIRDSNRDKGAKVVYVSNPLPIK